MSTETTIAQEYIYRGRVLNLRVDDVRLATGATARREVVEHRDAVAVVPLDGAGNVLLVRQFRKAVEQELLEIPAGVAHDGERPEETALRELSEETGLTGGTLTWLSSFYTSPGFSNELLHVYLATDLRPQTGTPDEDEDIAAVWLPFSDALAMISTGELRDAKTISGLLLAARRG